MNILLVAGGKLNIDQLRAVYKQLDTPYVIGVDRGNEYVGLADIKPDIAIGDFDSVDESVVTALEAITEVERLNPIKDDTDTEHALRYALGMKPEKLICMGCTGTRMDQTLASINLLRLACDAGVDAYILDETNRIRVTRGEFRITREKQFGKYVSVMPFENEITHLTETGFKYEVQDITLGKVLSLGVSNELVEDEGIISSNDYMIIMETRD
ncbi:thiamine pyrophosphokinase [Lachnospiraceae bacterium NE2001]|nr:thiamine pyrophosphokinase [Lachnospiraceae bacterium NE2001]